MSSSIASDLDLVAEFAAEMVATDDIDPLYPVLRKLYETSRLSKEDALRFTSVYLAFYNVASGFLFWKDGTGEIGDSPPYPTAIERRNLRPRGQFYKHMESLVRETNEWVMVWTQQGWGDDPEQNYEIFWERAQTIYGNGRWAAFKWAELLKKVHNLPLAAPDIRAKYCSGPVEGLSMIYGIHNPDATWRVYNQLGEMLQADLFKRGVRLDIEGVETIACNWASMVKGNYYVGHDWDELRGQLFNAGLLFEENAKLWQPLLRSVMPQRYYEHGSIGVDKTRCKAFRDTGKLLLR